jgi:hypothetical protein
MAGPSVIAAMARENNRARRRIQRSARDDTPLFLLPRVSAASRLVLRTTLIDRQPSNHQKNVLEDGPMAQPASVVRNEGRVRRTLAVQ